MADEKESKGGLLVSAAKKVGAAAGKIASLTGVAAAHETEPAPKAAHKGKLPKKNKSRLPRREKKAQRRAPSGAGV